MDWLDSLEQGAVNAWNDFDLNKFVQTASQAYVAIERANQAAATVTGPGSIRTLPDGSTARVNADGSLTVISRAGQVQNIGTSGAISFGAGQLIPGIPNVYLIGGAVLLVALVALRR